MCETCKVRRHDYENKNHIRTSNIIYINTKNFFNLFVICIPPKGVSEIPFLCVHVHIVGMTRYQKVTDSCDSYLDRIQEIKEAVVSLGVSKHA